MRLDSFAVCVAQTTKSLRVHLTWPNTWIVLSDSAEEKMEAKKKLLINSIGTNSVELFFVVVNP